MSSSPSVRPLSPSFIFCIEFVFTHANHRARHFFLFRTSSHLAPHFPFIAISRTTILNLVLVKALNEDLSVHGILIQLPLPEHIDSKKVLLTVSEEKDVDGFHPIHMGAIMLQIAKLYNS